MSNLQDIEIIDAHFHQWDPANTPHGLRPIARLFGWSPKLYQAVCQRVVPKDIAASLGTLQHMINPYLPSDYQKDVQDHNVTSAVFTPYSWVTKKDIELANETQYVDDLFNRKDPSIKVNLAAIVGNAHLENTECLQSVLDHHKQASVRFRGIRDMIDWCDDLGIATHARKKRITYDKDWLAGFELLAKNNLFFDAFAYHENLPEMDRLARLFPDTDIILSHMGIPIGALGPYASYGKTESSRQDVISIWKEGMARLAENDNVVVKLSGLFMPILGWNFDNKTSPHDFKDIVRRLKPLVDFTIDYFGPERCMFGSHFAPDKGSISYSMMYDVYKAIVEEKTFEQQEMLFAGNAKRIYKI